MGDFLARSVTVGVYERLRGDVLGCRLMPGQKLNIAELASRLFIGEATVKSHVSSLLTKLACRDRVQLVVAAYEAGLVTPGAS